MTGKRIQPRYLFGVNCLGAALMLLRESGLRINFRDMKLIRSIKRSWYKGQRYTPYYSMVFGKFRVLYPDGKKSIPMDWPTAKGYAKMFGGKVIDNF